MERTLYKSLINWKIKENRRPLILNGARQVGKTYLINEFAKNEYKKFAFFSLDRQPLVREVFERGGDTGKIIRNLSALSETDITPHDTLIFLDEIQDCPKALESLKYFCEDAPDYHIVVAGSLLG